MQWRLLYITTFNEFSRRTFQAEKNCRYTVYCDNNSNNNNSKNNSSNDNNNNNNSIIIIIIIRNSSKLF